MFSEPDQGGGRSALPWARLLSWKGKKGGEPLLAAFAASHLVVGHSCTSQGPRAGKVFTLPGFWNFLGNLCVWWCWRPRKFHWLLLLPRDPAHQICCVGPLFAWRDALFFPQHLVATFKMVYLDIHYPPPPSRVVLPSVFLRNEFSGWYFCLSGFQMGFFFFSALGRDCRPEACGMTDSHWGRSTVIRSA